MRINFIAARAITLHYGLLNCTTKKEQTIIVNAKRVLSFAIFNIVKLQSKMNFHKPREIVKIEV